MPKLILVFFGIIVSHVLQGQNLNTDSLIHELARARADTGIVILYRILAGTLRLTNPARGIEYGKAGVTLGKKLGFDKGTAGCYLNITACYSTAGKVDSAIIYIDTAIIYSHRAGDPNRLALAYLNRADFHMQLQNFDQSLKDCDTSLRYAEQANNDDRRARVFQTIGSVYFFQKLYDQSAEYYNRANRLYKKVNNLQMSAIVSNNLALIYKNTNQYKKAAEILEQAIDIADSLNDLSNLSLYYGTLSDVYFNSGHLPFAEKYANTSMHYAQQMKNDFSIATAREYLGQVYVKQNKTAEAITALNDAYVLFKKIGDISKVSSSADLLSQAYAKTSNYEKALEFANLSREMNDTLIRQRYDRELAAMQARFRVDEKDKEIQLLNKNKEIQVQKLSRQKVLIVASVALLALLLIGIALLVSKNRLRQRMKELELRNRIATDLHDEVGSSLSSIHVMSNMATRLQERPGKLQETLVKISTNAHDTMERMSDIVWAIHPANDTLEQLIYRMKDFAADILDPLNIHYEFTIEEDLASVKLSVSQRRDIYLVFKEAVNNAAKYSRCANIDIKLLKKEDKLMLLIADDGEGFETSMSHGNGLNNMQQRARVMGGKLSIDSGKGKGTTISLATKA